MGHKLPRDIQAPIRQPKPSIMVIFGASGDLTRRKLIPALFHLHLQGRLPQHFAMVGFARSQMDNDTFRDQMRTACLDASMDEASNTATWDAFAHTLHYFTGQYTEPESYEVLSSYLDEIDDTHRTEGNRVYYLSVAPQVYGDITANLGAAKLAYEPRGTWRRIIVEKPFGHDLPGAIALNNQLHEVFAEYQVYRIDHYLGKETVQNMVVFRFANAIFEPLWNRDHVDHVQITVAESVGIGTRAGYYDGAGVVRDMFQNHLLQLLSLTAMEPPVAFEARALRDEKVKVLRAVRPIAGPQLAQNSVRGQYTAGTLNGEALPGYCQLAGVAPDSQTPTFAALKLHVDNWRWQGVPFYLRSGKALADKVTEIIVQFKRPPHLLFEHLSEQEASMRANFLRIRIQPDEGIDLRFEAKQPGPDLQRLPVEMDFDYSESFGIEDPPDAYERLLLDCLLGDASLFTRADEIELAWSLVDPVLAAWQAGENAPPLSTYAAGSWGPPAADEMLDRDDRAWRNGD